MAVSREGGKFLGRLVEYDDSASKPSCSSTETITSTLFRLLLLLSLHASHLQPAFTGRWVCRRHYVFGLSVCECVCFPACVLLARYLTNQWMEFHLTMTNGIQYLIKQMKLIRFWRSMNQGQGHTEVKYLSYCCVQRHTHRCRSINVLSSLPCHRTTVLYCCGFILVM